MKPIILAAGLLALATPALADPCEAVPNKGPLPAYLHSGAVFSGPAAYVGDGDMVCVAVGPGQGQWVEVRLADFYAPELSAPGGREAKAALERITRGKRLRCVSEGPKAATLKSRSAWPKGRRLQSRNDFRTRPA